MRVDVDASPYERDTRCRRRLTGDRQERLRDLDFTLGKVDDTADLEYHDARPVSFERFQQRTRTGRGKRRNPNDFAAAATRCFGRPPLRAWKGDRSFGCMGDARHAQEEREAERPQAP